MSDEPTLLYLEADDEVTAVVRRLRESPAGRVILVTPGRSRATSSVVTNRLLARAATDDGQELVVVGDALTRSLAAEAGIAAFGTVAEARAAALPASVLPVDERTQARINVVRGPVAADEAPTLAGVAVAAAGVGVETRPVSIPRQRPRAVPRSRPVPARRGALVGVLALAAAFLVVATVAGAMLLPAADISVTPRTEVVGPVSYTLEMPDAERVGGTVNESATVTATGSYETLEPATGEVTFRNFNIVAVEVPQGTRVAAGDVVFLTAETVVAPPGSLTGVGTIAGGEVSVGVTAQAAGPGGNVAAEAIDTILDETTRNRLRGFPQNSATLVLNPAPTQGGVQESGPEIVQADVDAAVTRLRETLTERVADEMPDEEGRIVLRPDAAAEPTIEVSSELVGTRDTPEAEVSGSVAWEAFVVERSDIEESAMTRFADDTAARPPGHELLDEATRVTIGEARLEDGVVVADVTVTSLSSRPIDEQEVLDLAIGRSEAEAEAVLAELGDADVELWPGWVESVPDQKWRVDVRIEDLPEPSPPATVPVQASPSP